MPTTKLSLQKQVRFVPLAKAAKDFHPGIRYAMSAWDHDKGDPITGFFVVPKQALWSISLPNGSEIDVPALPYFKAIGSSIHGNRGLPITEFTRTSRYSIFAVFE